MRKLLLGVDKGKKILDKIEADETQAAIILSISTRAVSFSVLEISYQFYSVKNSDLKITIYEMYRMILVMTEFHQYKSQET